jgi:hypothetical protein
MSNQVIPNPLASWPWNAWNGETVIGNLISSIVIDSPRLGITFPLSLRLWRHQLLGLLKSVCATLTMMLQLWIRMCPILKYGR